MSSRNITFTLLFGALLALYPVQRWCESETESLRFDQEYLYLTDGTATRKLAFGYEALLADLYWIRTIQYFGEKVLNDETVLDTRSDKLKLLYPLADMATTLDPNYTQVYRFAGFFIHDYVDVDLGITLLEKGVSNNPDDIRILQTLAYLYWSDGRCAEAARVYRQGAEIPGAPDFFRISATTVHAECGDIKTSFRLLASELASTSDPRVRETLEKRLAGYLALAEIDQLNEAASFFRQRTGRNPESLDELMRAVSIPATPGLPALRLNSQKLPLDPNGTPYLYSKETGKASVDPQSMPDLPKPVIPSTSRTR